MPLDLQARLELAKTDPNMVSYIFGGVELSQNSRYLTDRLAGDCDKYSEMLLEPQISGPLGERVGALLGRRVIVEPASIRQIDRDAADTAQRILEFNVIPYEKICKNFLLTGLIFDFAVQAVVDVEEREVIYPVTKTDAQGNETQEVAKQTLIVPRLEFVPQRRFTFRYFEPENKDVFVCTDEDLKPEDIALVDGYELRLLTRRSPINGERCPKDRFFTYSCDGIGAQIRKFYEIRKEVLKSGVLTGDRLGSPPTHGTYPADLDPKDPEQAAVLTAFNRLLRAISPNAHASTTEGFKINFLEASKSGGHEILVWLYDTAGIEITRAIWGQGSHADKDTGSYGAEVQQAQNRNENVVDSDCNSQDEQLAPQFWEWIRKYNYPKANGPIVRRETFADRRKAEQEKAKEEHRSSRVQTDVILINTIGLSVTQEYITETYGPEFSLPAAESAPAPEVTDLSEADFAAHVNRYLDWNGLRLGVRNRPGETRFPQYRTAKKLQSGYGFIQGMKHGDRALRCYIHPGLLSDEPLGSQNLYEVTQIDPKTGDVESKIMVGYGSIEAAELAYRREMIAPSDLAQYADYAEEEWRLYFFEGRRTGVIARSAEEARKKLKRGGAKLVKVRALTEAERKIAARGDWVRSGPNGEPPGYNPNKRGLGPAPTNHAEPDDLDVYEQQLNADLSQAYADTLIPIQEFIDRIASSDATDEEKYRQFSDGIYELFEQMDDGAIATVLGEGLAAGYLAGMFAERGDRNAAE
ncbi:hypothetical protein HY772_05600 [Candidatus Woesearchaeota archaeon]|nr:hypothetical protein [Candidatus Woesearchaeota archaeon]